MDITKIKSDLAEKIKTIDPLSKKLKFKLDEHFILIDGTNETNVLRDTDEEADCTITMSLETYFKIQQGKLNPMMATLTGKIKVKGDIGLAQKLKQLM